MAAKIETQSVAQKALATKVDGVDKVITKAAEDAKTQADTLAAEVAEKNAALKELVSKELKTAADVSILLACTGILKMRELELRICLRCGARVYLNIVPTENSMPMRHNTLRVRICDADTVPLG